MIRGNPIYKWMVPSFIETPTKAFDPEKKAGTKKRCMFHDVATSGTSLC